MERKSRRALVDRWLLNFGAVLGSLCLVLAALSLLFGLKPLIFSSGSMGPAIPTGSLALAIPVAAAEVSRGEVVSVVASDGTRVTHRVVSADTATGLVLKGDANAVADLQPYTGATADRVLFSLPGLGYVLSWLASPWVFLLGGLLCAYLIYVAFFRTRPDAVGQPRAGSEDGTVSGAGKQRTRRRTWLGIIAMAAVIAVAIPLGAAAKVESTQAAWIATAVATSSMTADGLTTVPGGLTCAQVPGPLLSLRTDAKLTWTGLSQPYPSSWRHALRLEYPTGLVRYALPSSEAQKTVTVAPDFALLGLLGQSYQVKASVVMVLLDGSSQVTWTSPPDSGPQMSLTSNTGLLAGLASSLRCN